MDIGVRVVNLTPVARASDDDRIQGDESIGECLPRDAVFVLLFSDTVAAVVIVPGILRKHGCER